MDTEAPTSTAAVTGEIVLPEDAFIPDGASVSTQIQDVSLQDVAATVIGESVMISPEVSAEGTIPFEVEYDPDEIDERNTYAMSVRIEDENGSLVYINDTVTPVITNGAPTTDVAVEVIEVGAPAGDEADAPTEDEDMAADEATESPSA